MALSCEFSAGELRLYAVISATEITKEILYMLYFLIFTSAVVPHCKKYLVKMTASAWLLQFQGSLNR